MKPLIIRQLGYVTDDLEASALAWVDTTGAGPFFVLPGMGFRSWTYQGKPQQMTLDIAFGQAGDMMIELIRPNGQWPNVYGDSMPKGCVPHHHGVLVKDVEASARSMGGEAVTRAELSTETELRYFDCRDRTGLFVELITDNDESRGFFAAAIEATQNWDGHTCPVRPFSTGES
ncbi:VOC family protein [Sphingorhabdus sp. SMR4y]|uniref:VOC family protein n=1 Tax=Sphingorhabdus sp. SMR4y TaxID=2584094 RepID=UPI000B5CF28D|nr:VOC family protein [Sphingorhabdus sp. SMR4y]ASK89290.1 glyoxalase/bleomycin resistance protein/dioxygenase superfamily protein [Sphingorhabdus sp. SMR4y]